MSFRWIFVQYLVITTKVLIVFLCDWVTLTSLLSCACKSYNAILLLLLPNWNALIANLSPSSPKDVTVDWGCRVGKFGKQGVCTHKQETVISKQVNELVSSPFLKCLFSPVIRDYRLWVYSANNSPCSIFTPLFLKFSIILEFQNTGWLMLLIIFVASICLFWSALFFFSEEAKAGD